MKLRLAIALSILASPAWAQIPLITGPQDVASLNATLNKIIAQINVITASLTGGGPSQPNSVLGSTTSPIVLGSANAVNQVAITGGATGVGPIIAADGAMSDTNVNLTVASKGTGHLVLDTQTSGPIQFASVASFVPARGLAPCPATLPGEQPMLGTSKHIRGYLIFVDWLGKTHAVPSC